MQPYATPGPEYVAQFIPKPRDFSMLRADHTLKENYENFWILMIQKYILQCTPVIKNAP